MKWLYRKNICVFWYTLKETNHIIITNRPPRRKGWERRGGEEGGSKRNSSDPSQVHQNSTCIML